MQGSTGSRPASAQWRNSRVGGARSRASKGTHASGEYTGSDAIAFELTEHEAGRRFESRIVSTDLPFGGRWLIALSPLDGGRTRVRIRGEGVVHSPLFRALAHYIFGHTATMEAYLEDLARSFEEGDHGT